MITQDASSRSQSDGVDTELIAFVQQIANSFVKWDLIRFFNENPHAVEHAEVLARYSSRETRDVEPQLEALVENGILRSRMVSGVKAFTLTPDQGTRAIVSRFVQACDDKQFRLIAIQHVMQIAGGRAH